MTSNFTHHPDGTERGNTPAAHTAREGIDFMVRMVDRDLEEARAKVIERIVDGKDVPPHLVETLWAAEERHAIWHRVDRLASGTLTNQGWEAASPVAVEAAQAEYRDELLSWRAASVSTSVAYNAHAAVVHDARGNFVRSGW